MFTEDNFHSGSTGVIFQKDLNIGHDLDRVILLMQQGGIVDWLFSMTMSSRFVQKGWKKRGVFLLFFTTMPLS